MNQFFAPAFVVPRQADRHPVAVVHVDATEARVRLLGDLDAASAGEAMRALSVAAAYRWVKVDLGDLDFCDAAGLSCLVETHRQCAERRGRLRLTNPQPSVRRLLEITGLDVLLADELTG